jgi:hypothetical protein
MTKNFLATVFILCLLSFLSQTAYACSCSFGSLRDTFFSSDAVFAGKVIKIETVEEASVGLILKESGKLKPLKNPRFEKSVRKLQSVTFEVIESFKGTKDNSFVLTTAVYNGGGSCGVPFKVGENYLVFAYKSRPMLSKEEAEQPKESWTLEMRLKAEADELNKQLPPYGTNICVRTDNLRFMKKEIEEIRNFL